MRSDESNSTNSRASFRVSHVRADAAARTAIYAEHTRYWREASYEDFEKGTMKGVALRSDGKLVLAPKFTHLADPGSHISGRFDQIPKAISTPLAVPARKF